MERPCRDAQQESDDDFKIKGAAVAAATTAAATNSANSYNGQNTKKTIIPESCSICLDPITERAVAVPCNHLTFDFLCLVSWLQQQTACPLCKTAVTEVQYDFRGPSDWKSYHVSPEKAPDQKEDNRQNTHASRRQRGQRAGPGSRSDSPASSSDPALERRKDVYRHRRYSLHVGANDSSGYQDITAIDIADSPALQSKVRTFLRRELLVFSYLDTASRGRTRDFLVEYILAIVKSYDVRGADGQAQRLLSEHLSRANASILLHELYSWLRSPLETLAAWDEHVQYSQREDHVSGTVKERESD